MGEELAVGTGADRRCQETTKGVRGWVAPREGSASAVMKRGRAKGQSSRASRDVAASREAASDQDTVRVRGQRMREKQSS